MDHKNITPQEAKKRLDSGEDIIIVHVGGKERYACKRIPKSINIPADILADEAEARLPDKNATIFIYCPSGWKSIDAAIFLAGKGYSNVYNLGSIVYWPYELEMGEKTENNSI